ncbi:hypothetical protein [Sporosarcina luteola]|uniref:hypothetical protein n=1 Tax=Sporosarcina luteola TaxID=582850 RepID=UPI00203DDDB2|nr:hypothetical protein [Sporosarcina luteola]MCM3711326.1 hypothetical protein [Sporosarcina luteola]
MNSVKESAGRNNSFVVSLLINITFGLVIYGAISFLVSHYFENFWTNWVLFVSCLAIAYIAWKELDPYKGKWHLNGWMTRVAGVVALTILAFTVGF